MGTEVTSMRGMKPRRRGAWILGAQSVTLNAKNINAVSQAAYFER